MRSYQQQAYHDERLMILPVAPNQVLRHGILCSCAGLLLFAGTNLSNTLPTTVQSYLCLTSEWRSFRLNLSVLIPPASEPGSRRVRRFVQPCSTPWPHDCSAGNHPGSRPLFQYLSLPAILSCRLWLLTSDNHRPARGGEATHHLRALLCHIFIFSRHGRWKCSILPSQD